MSGRIFNAKAIRAIMGIIAFVVFPLASWAEPVDETPEFSCSINGQIEDADGNSYEIRGLLEIENLKPRIGICASCVIEKHVLQDDFIGLINFPVSPNMLEKIEKTWKSTFHPVF